MNRPLRQVHQRAQPLGRVEEGAGVGELRQQGGAGGVQFVVHGRFALRQGGGEHAQFVQFFHRKRQPGLHLGIQLRFGL